MAKPPQKNRRKKRNSDPSWTRARELANIPYRKKRKRPIFIPKSQIEGLLQLNNALGTELPQSDKLSLGPVEKNNFLSPNGKKVTAPILTTPTKGVHSSGVLVDKDQYYNVLQFQINNQKFGLFLKNSTCHQKRLELKSPKSKEFISNLPTQACSIQTVKITQDSYLKHKKAIQERKICGQSTRQPSNNAVMNNNSAYTIGQNAGLEIAQRDLHWTHLVPHAIVGNETAQRPENLGLATKQANASMELVNSMIESILFYDKNNDKLELTLTATPKFVEGYATIRLLKTIHYELQDNKGNKISFNFDMLSQNAIPKHLIRNVQDAIMYTFHGKKLDDVIVLASPAPTKENTKSILFSPAYTMYKQNLNHALISPKNLVAKDATTQTQTAKTQRGPQF